MAFEELWRIVGELNTLPEQAILPVSHSLSDGTKNRLCRRRPERVAEIVLWAIRQIDKGSVETVDALVNRKAWEKDI